jgi:hypothetical protein
MSAIVRNFAAWAVKTFFNDNQYAESLKSARVRSTYEQMKCVAERDEYVKLFYEQVCFRKRLPVQDVGLMQN